MRTICGLAGPVRLLVPRGFAERRIGTVVPRGHRLLDDAVGDQYRDGVRLDQVDGTTCGSAVLVALAAWADPAEAKRLARSGFDERQRQVHRETNRLWPRALGTTPWGMVRWLHDHAPDAGRYEVRLVDDTSAADVADLTRAVTAALAVDRPVPLLVGSLVPRHYVLALAGSDRVWRVYEPSSGSVRALHVELVRRRRLVPVVGFDRLHAALLPAGP
ncbi:hypothetical protein [Pseudonocardia asaccharolytica]|uniref:Peptidase C39-like domain-containing protein n=1 Tax=Pseudonocardia asaccharolytica DSM 44247 = NBRC 16224 TaxID=1123024 RepID=A0A511CWF6_9PSEU|nr:hypothetical protein [Pseudonocardia asaccharolytica]GEL16807.1 hypothetical protein PA7_06440 [Pseudonocardia asaccharolytica DSM 44247 = NBRC 16224]